MSDSQEPRRRLAERLEAAGLSAERFISVRDGEKASTDHEQHSHERVSGNYGVYANGDDALCIIDVDDYGDQTDKQAGSALHDLPETLEQGSPHGGTHHFYRVEPTDDGRLVAAALSDTFGNANLPASWGEVRVSNQYVVGAGSQLDGCGKDWCSACADPDDGYYVIQADREIATISAEQLISTLAADPELSKDTSPDRPTSSRPRPQTDVSVDVYDVISPAYEAGERHAHPVHGSDTGQNFMVDEDAETWRCWRHSCTGNALHLLGVEEGIISCGEWQGTGLGSETWADIFSAARSRGLDVGDPPDGTENGEPPVLATDGAQVDEDEVERGEAILRAETTPTEPYGSLVHQNGHYGYRYEDTDQDGNTIQQFARVCNFTLELLEEVRTYKGKLLHIRVHPASPFEQPYTVQVEPAVFNSPSTFREEIVTGRTTFWDPQHDPSQTLTELRLTVGHQHAPRHEGTEYIGLHGDDYDEWVTPAGTLTTDGWVTNPNYKYYEKGGTGDRESSLEEKWQLSPGEGADYDQEAVGEILERIPNVRTTERGLPILGWWYAAPLKPLIHDAEGEFNLLQVTGDTEAGKTSLLQLYYRLFGADPDPFGCGDTRFTIQKKFAGSCGLPIWLDEYKPSDLSTGQLNWLHRMLRQVTRSKSISKGQQDLGELVFKMRAPVVFSGEQTVSEPAVRRRAILTHLTTSGKSGAHERAYCELAGGSYETADGERYAEGYDLSEHARAYYRYVLSKDPEEVTQAWQRARERTREHLRALGAVDLDGSELQGLQTIVFGVVVYREFANQHDVPETAWPDKADVRQALAHVVDNIGPDGRRREHIDEFVELMTAAASAGYLEQGEHYRVYEPQMNDGEPALAFHMPSVFNSVKKYARDYNVEEEHSLLGKNDYLDSFRDKAGGEDSYPLAVSHRVRGIENGARAVVLDPQRAAELLPGEFELSAFTGEQPAPDEEAEMATPVVALEAGGDPYATVTVQLAAYRGETSGPETGPVQSGTVRDETGPIDFVDWFGCECQSLLEDAVGECFRLRDVRVGRDGDGNRQLEIVNGVTEVEPIQQGVGTTAEAETDDEQTDLSGGDEATADGAAEGADDGPVDLTHRVLQALADAESAVRPEVLADELDEDPPRVVKKLQELARERRTVLRDNDQYRYDS